MVSTGSFWPLLCQPKLPSHDVDLGHCCWCTVVPLRWSSWVRGNTVVAVKLWELQRSSEWMTDHTVDDSEVLYQDNMDWNYQDLPEIWPVPLTLEKVRDQVDSRDETTPWKSLEPPIFVESPVAWTEFRHYLSRGLSSSKRKFTIETKWWQPDFRDFLLFLGSFSWMITNQPSHLQPHCL